MVIEKPAGLLSQGDISGEENLVDCCRSYFGRNYVGLVHRLDRNVSGLMVIAKRSKSADRLSEALRNGTLIRKYIACVEGDCHSEFKLKSKLLKNEKTNEVRVLRDHENHPLAKEAILYGKKVGKFQSLEKLNYSFLEISLETGRSHQIRVQLSHAGHPIVNDHKYGGKSAEINKIKSSDLLLHSSFLEFPHPMSKEICTYQSRPKWFI